MHHPKRSRLRPSRHRVDMYRLDDFQLRWRARGNNSRGHGAGAHQNDKSGGRWHRAIHTGFGGGQAAFEGNLAPEKIIEFYKKEMPARGWQPGTRLLSGGGMLSYSKEGKTILLGVRARNGNAALSVTVANTGK